MGSFYGIGGVVFVVVRTLNIFFSHTLFCDLHCLFNLGFVIIKELRVSSCYSNCWDL